MITLIHPPIDKNSAITPPLSLAYLSGSLIEHGYKDIIKIIDMRINDEIVDDELRKSDLIGITSTTYGFLETVKVIKKIKNIADVPIVLGGPHASLFGGKILKELKDLDFILKGEGEYSLVKLLDGSDYSEIEGLAYRANGKIVENDVKLIENLDSLPFPKYDHFNLDGYKRSPETFQISTSRGCPYNCIYCGIKHIMGRKYRYRSPENVVDEIEELYKKYGTKEFHIVDDNFTVKRERVEKICDLLIERELNIKFWPSSGMRVDGVDRKLLEKMKRAGLYKVSFGIESCDPTILKNIKKGITIEDIKRAVNDARELGLEVRGFFIVGSPGETFEKATKSLDYAKELGLSSMAAHMLTPFPGTELWEWVQENGLFIGNPYNTLYNQPLKSESIPSPMFETPEFTKHERERAYNYALSVKKTLEKRTLLITAIKKIKSGNIELKNVKKIPNAIRILLGR